MRTAFARRVAIVLLAFSISSGCLKRETPVQAGIRTQTLHIGNWGDPATFDPHLVTGVEEVNICSALYEGLVNLANDGRTILPGVAERWEVSPDGHTHTFHLRAHARWSNGEPVTAEDFAESLRRILDPRLACATAEDLYPIRGAKAYVRGESTDFATVGVRARDSRTLEVTLQSRAPYFLSVCDRMWPVHLATLDKFGGRYRRDGKGSLPGQLVTNGPFVLKEWRQAQFLVLVPNPHYWNRARMRLSEIRMYPITDEAAEERAYRAGQLHVTDHLPATKIDFYRRQQPAELQQKAVLHCTLVTFNTKRPPFDDARVRRAFSLAIDRQKIVTKVFHGAAQAARSLTRPGMGGLEPPALVRHDPEEARRFLTAAGFPGGRGFPAVEFRFIAASPGLAAMAESLQQMWQQTLGVRVSLRQMEGKVHGAELASHDYQFGTVGFYSSIDDPEQMLQIAGQGFSFNYADWSDPRYDAGLAAAGNASTDAERLEAFCALERMLADEVPYAPILHWNSYNLVHPTVRGWRSNPFGRIDWRELALEPPR